VTLRISWFVQAVLAACLFLAPVASAQESPTSTTTVNDLVTDASGAFGKTIQATVTGYATGADGGAVGSMTATGVTTHWGTVAADWRLYPPGTRLLIEGFPNDVFTVEDSGGAVRGNIIDIWFPDLAVAAAFGTKSLKVSILAN
jgi:3D (Asp-Asp-Asp) domain-containing protein